MPKKQTPEEKARRKEARRRRDKAHRVRVRQMRDEIKASSKIFDHLKVKADGIAAEEKRLQEVHNQIQIEEEDELKVIRAKYAGRYEKCAAELKITVQARRDAYDDWRLSRDEAVRKVEDRFPDLRGSARGYATCWKDIEDSWMSDLKTLIEDYVRAHPGCAKRHALAGARHVLKKIITVEFDEPGTRSRRRTRRSSTPTTRPLSTRLRPGHS